MKKQIEVSYIGIDEFVKFSRLLDALNKHGYCCTLSRYDDMFSYSLLSKDEEGLIKEGGFTMEIPSKDGVRFSEIEKEYNNFMEHVEALENLLDEEIMATQLKGDHDEY